jgi:hypothetical protein
MPPRVFQKRAKSARQQADRRARPTQESRSDQKEQERAEREAQARRDAQARKEREKKTSVPKTKPKPIQKSPQHSFADKLGRSPTRDPRDNQNQPSGTSAVQRMKINNAVKTTTNKSKMSPPLSKPKSPTKFTIKGGTIKGGTIYKDPITGSTLAGKETRMKAITDPQSVRVQDSRAVKTGGPKGFSRKGSLMTFDDTSLTEGQNPLTPFQNKQVSILNNLNNPQETKLDLVTKEPVQNTLLTELSKRRKKRQGSGFTGIMSQIRSLLG